MDGEEKKKESIRLRAIRTVEDNHNNPNVASMENDAFCHRAPDSVIVSVPPSRSVSVASNDTVAIRSLTEYEHYLNNSKSKGNAFLRQEFHSLAKSNSDAKLQVFCNHLKALDVQLHSDQLLGEKYQETAFHIAVLNQNMDCAKLLITAGGTSLICKPYASKDYKGVTALHSAITKKDEAMVELILSSLNSDDKRDLLQMRGQVPHPVGRFKCPWIPLHLAAAMGSIAVFRTLLNHGADLFIRDENDGNTVLHSLAKLSLLFPDECVSTLKNILGEIQNLPSTGETDQLTGPQSTVWKLLKSENDDGFTPFIFAACVGAVDFVKAITEVDNVYKFKELDLVPGAHDVYDMSEMDTAVTSKIPPSTPPNGKKLNCAKLSAIEILVYATPEEYLDLGKIPALHQVMWNKWEANKNYFCIWGVFHLAVMICYSSLVMQQETSLNSTVSNSSNSTCDSAFEGNFAKYRKPQNIILFIVAVLYFISEVWDILTSMRKGFLQAVSLKGMFMTKMQLSLQGETHRPLQLLFSLSTILLYAIPGSIYWHRALYSLGAISGWCFLLMFTRAFKNIGIFTTMMRKMMIRITIYFSVLVVISLIGFTTATYALYPCSAHNNELADVSSFGNTMFTLFRVFVGDYEYQLIDEAGPLSWALKIVLILFVIMFTVLFLNMLIAAMSNTFTRLEKRKVLMWLKTRTNGALMVERRWPWWLRQSGRDNYLHLSQSKSIYFIGAQNCHIQEMQHSVHRPSVPTSC